MRGFEIGDIIILHEGSKQRPVVIVQNGLGVDIDITVVRVTTRKGRNQFDVKLEHWEEAGLDEASIVRCGKINTFQLSDNTLKIGSLHESDLEKVEAAVLLYFTTAFDQRKKKGVS